MTQGDKMNDAPGRTITQNGQTYLFFSGYSYLGMSGVPAFIDLLKEGIDRYGALFPSSRISNTNLPLYAHLEHYLSQLTRQEETVTFASGYLACEAIGQCLRRSAAVWIAPGKHPAGGWVAPQDTLKLSFEDWCEGVIESTSAATAEQILLVADAVDPLQGRVHDFTFLRRLPPHKNYTVLIDDSHGIGWRGAHGGGVAESLEPLPYMDYVIVYSLAKGLHVQGGAVSCPAHWAERLRRSPLYTASTAMAPGFAHTLLHAGPLYETQRAHLRINMDLLTAMAGTDSGLVSTSMPVFLCTEPGVGAYPEEKGILISSFAYPDPEGSVLNRVVVNALHHASDLDKLVGALRNFTDRL
jgi:8-amino-7-oxononanoate synthase